MQTVEFSIAIGKDNELIYSKGFDFGDLDHPLKVNANTLFPIGSSYKAFTTDLLRILEEEYELKFSDSLKKHVPELEFYNN
ncbi:beta-lactamase family protein [Formosa sediminum]|uniref:Beta-lactamase family protein n=1 Tax=Formosa sediminum TaxID=2594004 RepID=A0A516GW11_9FLAO|nr:beta-lactamase family protein [Formosa sediminum]